MLAAVTRSPGELVVEDVGGPRRARPGHVIVRPEAVGICGSGFHLFSGDVAALSGASQFSPLIQGHEVAAIVEDPGDSAHETNTRVAIWPLLPCGRCYPCRISRPSVCPAFRLVGVHLDGGLQERLEVQEEPVFNVGDLDADCASFVEPAPVAVHAVARGRLKAGEKTVILGFPRRDKPGYRRPRQDIPAFLAPFPAGSRGRGIRIRDGQAAGRGQDRGERELTQKENPTAPRGTL